MRLEDLQVELRPRSPWEAVELGIAMARRHARAVWLPWLLCSLPVFAAANAIAWWFDAVPWAALVLWWLKPVFDRVPLFVLSRAVFGATPSLRQALAAQGGWGWRALAGYLTWRRFGMARALYLPVDFLEGGAHVAARRRVIGGSVRSVGVLLTLACAHFEAALVFGALGLALLFVPFEFLSDSANALWSTFAHQPPKWVQVSWNGLAWMAASAIEPFYVAAGFGLYLNRRTQLEAWDVEIAFRRLRRRLETLAAPAVLACVLVLGWPAAAQATAAATAKAEQACDCDANDKVPAVPMERIFGAHYVDAQRFGAAVDRAYRDPLLAPRKREGTWVRRRPLAPRKEAANPAFALVGRVIGVIGEWGLWIVLGIAVLLLAKTAPRWWPWLREAVHPPREARPADIARVSLPELDALPRDIVGEARRRWQIGEPRQALALLYRAGVDSMIARTGATLVPGATEAECLRAARTLAAEEREVFARTVRVWQYAAYAERLPAEDEFDALLRQLAQRFGWAA
jgi:hypothetical protein